MRILMTADTIGGVWTYALELAHALSSYGVEIHLATMGTLPTEQQRQSAGQVPNLRLYSSPFKLEWMENPWDDVRRAGDWLQTLAASIEPDLVHLNGYAHACLEFDAPVIVVAHSCVYSWWQAVKSETPPRQYEEYRCRVENGLQYADYVIAPTRAMLQALHQHYRFHASEQVISNGICTNNDHMCCKKPFVFSVGRIWDEAKNISALNRIAPRLGYPAYVAGMSRSPDGVSAAVSGITGLGFLTKDDLWRWYGHAAVYALPAYYEPFGLSVLEAAFSGCALVLGDIASLRENWTGVACFVPPDDDKAILSALRDLLSHPDKRARMGEKARQRAMQFSRNRMADAYWSIYREAVA